MKHLKNLVFTCFLVSLVFTSCSEDDIVDPGTLSSYAMFLVTDPNTSSGIVVSFDSMPSGEIDVTTINTSLQLSSTRSAGVAFGDALYHTSSTAGDPGIQKLEKGTDGRFKDAGFIPTNSQYAGGNMFGVVSKTVGYYSNDALSQTAIQIFDPSTMQRTGEIDCSEEINKFKNDSVVTTSFGGFMVERDGKLYTEVYFSDAQNMQVYDSTFVAVVDVATNTLDKIIIWPDFLLLGYGFKNTHYINVDENNDLYMASFIGRFDDPEGPNFRIIRIKNGETDFDKTWDINALRDFGGTENFALGCLPYNGKIYVKMFSNNIDNTWAGMVQKQYNAYEIDMITKKATRITDIPEGYWKSVNGPMLFDNKVYFIVENDDEGKAYYYTYDPATKKSKKEVTVVGGQPQNIVELTQ